MAEAVSIHQKLRKETLWDRMLQMLRLVRIPSPEARAYDYPHQMSGGMRQRVAGAIALSCQASLLVADEPTTNLDVTTQMEYLKLLEEIQSETGTAIIFITHDFGVVANMCHRVGVMYAGKIVETAKTRELFKAPRHPYTIALIDSVPRLDRKDERLYSIEGQPPSLMNLPSGCRFFPRCTDRLEVCGEKEPSEVEVGDGHSVACWKVS